MQTVINGQVKIRKGISKGKLPAKLRNALRNVRRNDLDVVDIDNERDNVSDSNEELNDSILWLKTNREPFSDVTFHWKKTFQIRSKSAAKSVAEYYNEWKVLYDNSKGHVLVSVIFICSHTCNYKKKSSISSLFFLTIFRLNLILTKNFQTKL